jgi:hypothetical protein
VCVVGLLVPWRSMWICQEGWPLSCEGFAVPNDTVLKCVSKWVTRQHLSFICLQQWRTCGVPFCIYSSLDAHTQLVPPS